jgi:hypothetical protein
MAAISDFRKQFSVALKNDASRDELLAIVGQHKACGLTQRAAYEILESIRAEIDCSEGSAPFLCEKLEDIMDQVWGFCPPGKAIWDKSLSETPP